MPEIALLTVSQCNITLVSGSILTGRAGMASYLLYIVTGAVLALMAARHLIVLRRALPPPGERPKILHALEGKNLHWAEATLAGAIFLFGLWMLLTAGLLFIATLLHSL